MSIYTMKEVRFDIYCPKCKHYEKSEKEDPCYQCLDNPMNEHSNKPVYYDEKEVSEKK